MDRLRSLRLRLTALVASLTAGAILLFARVFYVVLYANLLAETDDRLRDRAALVLAALVAAEQPDGRTRLSDLPPLVEFNAPGIYVELRGAAGELLAPNLGAERLPAAHALIVTALAREPTSGIPQAGDKENLRLFVTPVPDSVAPHSLLLVAESLEPTQATLAQAWMLLFVWARGVSAGSGWRFAAPWLCTRTYGTLDPRSCRNRGYWTL
jgi:hypothetical protein